jgi:hypothetical protein
MSEEQLTFTQQHLEIALGKVVLTGMAKCRFYDRMVGRGVI